MTDTRHIKDTSTTKHGTPGQQLDAFVLDKGIFSNVFDKDIKRVYVYKKAERLAKAIHLVSPAFRSSPAMRDRIDRIAVGLVDAAVLPPTTAKDALARELLALSSVLSIARAGGLLSAMNADLIAREAQLLLHEVAGYEEPRLFLEDAPTLAELARSSQRQPVAARPGTPVQSERRIPASAPVSPMVGEVSVSDMPVRGSRQEAILAILSEKGSVFIKDISMVIREVSEKTIQRELQNLIEAGKVTKTGERRWTTYSLAAK